MTGRCPFLEKFHNLFRKNICISILCFGIIRLETIGKQWSIVLEQIFITCLETFDQFLYPVQEFRLKIDILKNGTSHIGLYGSAPSLGKRSLTFKNSMSSKLKFSENLRRISRKTISSNGSHH